MIKRYSIAILFWFCCFGQLCAQQLTLEQCYDLAKKNYPLIRKLDLMSKTNDLTVLNNNKRYLPQLSFNGQATYQSEVVNYADLLGSNAGNFGFTPPTFSKDQYKILGEVEQLIFDAGGIKYQNELTKINTAINLQTTEAELYNLNERINNLFFSIFLLEEQRKLNTVKISTLDAQLKKTEAAYKFGTAYSSDVNELRAEIESAKSTILDLNGSLIGFFKMLSVFVGQEVKAVDQLVLPTAYLYTGQITRPELKLYDLRQKALNIQDKQLNNNLLPTFKAFFQGAYSRPTLNPLSNDFGAWYMVGVRMNWNLSSLYTVKKQRDILSTNQDLITVDKETFLRNVELDLIQQDENIQKIKNIISQDDKIIKLREDIVKSASAQLANGMITTSDYIRKLNEENIAKQNLILHQMQLLQTQYTIKYKSGNN